MKKRQAGAVTQAWKVFAKHPKERAEALAACEKAGINPNTAKTQWQRWLHSSPAERKTMVSGNKKKEVKKTAQEVAAQS